MALNMNNEQPLVQKTRSAALASYVKGQQLKLENAVESNFFTGSKSVSKENEVNITEQQQKKGADKDLINKVNDNINELYETEDNLKEQLSQTSPDSAESKMIQKRIEALDNVKAGLVERLGEEYPKGSPESNALQVTGSIIKENGKLDAINQRLLEIDNAAESLKNATDDSGMLQKRLEALNQIKQSLENMKTDTEKNLKELDRDLKAHLLSCAPEIKDTINNIVEKEGLKVGDNSEKITQFNDQIKDTYQQEIELREKLAQMPKSSTEAKQITQQLDQLSNLRVEMLNNLAESYPPDSSEAASLKVTGQVLQESHKMDAIDNYLDGLHENTNQLKSSLNGVEPDRAEAMQIQKRLEALQKVETRLLEEKTKAKENISSLKAELRNTLGTSAPEIKASIKNILKQEAISDRKADQAEKQSNDEKKAKISEYLEKLNEEKASLYTADGNAGQIQARLEAINAIEQRLLGELKNVYPPESKQVKAIDAMISLNKSEFTKQAINDRLFEIEEATANLTNQLGALNDPDSAEAQALKTRIEAIEKVKQELLEQKRNLSRDITKDKAKLRRNILHCPAEDRKFLADIRADHLHSNTEIQQIKLDSLSTRIDSYREAINSGKYPPAQVELIKEHLETLRQEYLSVRKDFRIDKNEEKYWNAIEKIPVRSQHR